MTGQMAIAMVLPGFNDLGRSMTPTSLSRNRFYLLHIISTLFKDKQKINVEVKNSSRFLSTRHQILPSYGCIARETMLAKCELSALVLLKSNFSTLQIDFLKTCTGTKMQNVLMWCMRMSQNLDFLRLPIQITFLPLSFRFSRPVYFRYLLRATFILLYSCQARFHVLKAMNNHEVNSYPVRIQ